MSLEVSALKINEVISQVEVILPENAEKKAALLHLHQAQELASASVLKGMELQ